MVKGAYVYSILTNSSGKKYLCNSSVSLKLFHDTKLKMCGFNFYLQYRNLCYEVLWDAMVVFFLEYICFAVLWSLDHPTSSGFFFFLTFIQLLSKLHAEEMEAMFETTSLKVQILTWCAKQREAGPVTSDCSAFLRWQGQAR